ncbi:MAG: hypothetical protein HONBIEJF_02863 [Fimbriimonadaceae bacterium]|nr:hypothetical protein [Fimbriimonadaceae bacterium]
MGRPLPPRVRGRPFGYGGAFGYQSEPDSGLQLLGHRYYDPSAGRFLSRDKARDGGNWYAYCGNSPLTNADPTGQIPLAVPLVLWGVAAWRAWCTYDFMTSINEFIDDPSIQNGLFLVLAVVGGGTIVKALSKGVKRMLQGQEAHRQLTAAYKALHGNPPGVRYNLKSLFGRGRPDIFDPKEGAVLDFKMITSNPKTIRKYQRQLIRYMIENDAEHGVIVWYKVVGGKVSVVNGPPLP